MEFFTDNILLIFILSLLAAIIAFSGHFKKFSVSRNTIIFSSITANIVGLIFSAALFIMFFLKNTEPFEMSIDWFRIGSLNLSVGVLADNISSVFLLILMLVSIIVQWYSAYYMKDESDEGLYFGHLNLLNTAMTALILSPNLPQTFIFFGLVGICSYLTVNFRYEKTKVSNAAKNVLIINRIGDMLFLAGLVILIYFVLSYPIAEGSELLTYSNLSETAADFYVYLSDGSFYLACMLLFCGTIVKSAQFPLHVWLIDSTEAPAPVNALINSATMVAAGVLLAIRLLPMFELSTYVTQSILYIGLITAFLSAFFAIGQTNIHKMLAYSTSSQIGLIIAVIGALAPSSALYYLTSHSFAKVALFLIAGIIFKYVTDKTSDMSEMGGLRAKYPILAYCYLISICSLSGIFFCGFIAKETVFESLLTLNDIPAIILFCSVLFMSGYCLFRSYFVIFEGELKQQEKKQIPSSLYNVVIVCTLALIAVTFLNKNLFTFSNNPSDFYILNTNNITIGLSSLLISVIAVIVACGNVAHKMPSLPDALRPFSLNGGYIPNIYGWVVDNIFDVFRNFVRVIDKYVLNGIANFQGYLARFVSWLISVSQNGNIQAYLAYAVATVGLILIIYLLIVVGIGEV